MKITSRLCQREGTCDVRLSTHDQTHGFDMPAKSNGMGTKANGGELLCLALASCFCNDIYREAASRSIDIASVDVAVEATFGEAGEPARRIEYSATVSGRATEQQLLALVHHTDQVTEIQNTIRQGMAVSLVSVNVLAQ